MENKKSLKFLIIAMAAHGKGISGGDRIFMECAQRWVKVCQVKILTWDEGYQMYKRQNIDTNDIKFHILNMKPWRNLGFYINYFARVISTIIFAFKINLDNEKTTIVYSASEFWMDSLPALILKLRFKKIIWMAAWYQTAPNPLIGFKEGERNLSYRFYAVRYWLMQLPIKPIITKFADFVLVNNLFEKKRFPMLDKENRVIVVLGAVDLLLVKRLLKKIKSVPKIYDGVFQGRFHPQKGVVELIDIWKYVLDKKPGAKLAMIGDGPLMKNVKLKIKNESLDRNIKLFGYVFDGLKKYKIFQQSRVVVHPAFYDSGGMASAEAMAIGLPAVGFNLKSYESYYPQGMIKAPVNDLKTFAENILRLLDDKNLYSKIGTQAKEMISQNWSWDQRAKEILNYLT